MEREPKSGPPSAISGKRAAVQKIRFLWKTDKNGIWSFPETNVDPVIQRFESLLSGTNLAGSSGDAILDSFDPLTQALAGRSTFEGVRTTWTDQTNQCSSILQFWGTPLYSADREFEGFQGFGFVIPASKEPTSEIDEESPATPKLGRQSTTRSTQTLSDVERQAFREIAKALSSSLETARREEPASASVQIEPEPSAHSGTVQKGSGTEKAALLESLIDRLPIGLLISRGSVPILMNRTLLQATGYDNVDNFYRDGGLERLFSGRDPERASLLRDDHAIPLKLRDGSISASSVHIQTINWDGLPATMMTFQPLSEPVGSTQMPPANDHDKHSARELSAILDTATDGVVVIDANGLILSVNRSAEALFGDDQIALIGEKFTVLLAPEYHSNAWDYLDSLKEGGISTILNDGREMVGLERHGGRIPLFITIGRIGDESLGKYCIVLRDVTPWKQVETRLDEARHQAEASSAQKSDFIARISHELRTPLSSIIGFTEIMMQGRFGPIDNERYQSYLRDIHTSGSHITSLVNDLLDLSKIEAGHSDLAFVEVDVNELLARTIGLLQPDAARGKVVMRSSLSSTLPKVIADERSLTQIFLNLLSNAVKFTNPGGQVIVSTELNTERRVVIRIRDTGIGMTEQDIATALEPFRQITTAGRSGGTGLGLTLTKALVTANRAALAISSEKDAGTLVEVTFPTAKSMAH